MDLVYELCMAQVKCQFNEKLQSDVKIDIPVYKACW